MSRINWTNDKLIARLLNNKTTTSYWYNIKVLRSRPSKELFIQCVAFTQSKEPKVRKIGIDLLAQFGLSLRPFRKEILELFFELLTIEKEPEVLMSLLYAIGHNNDELDKEQIKKLCAVQHNNNSLIKEGLVSALGFINNLEVIKILIKLSEDKLSHIRNWATFFITEGDKNNLYIREALWKRVNDKHQETKLEAILGLAMRKDNRVIEIIERELIDGEYGTLLFEAIIKTNNKNFLPLLQQNLKLIEGDSTINPLWIKDLKKCIADLSK